MNFSQQNLDLIAFKNKAICIRQKIFIFFSFKKKRDGPRQEAAQIRVPSPILENSRKFKTHHTLPLIKFSETPRESTLYIFIFHGKWKQNKNDTSYKIIVEIKKFCFFFFFYSRLSLFSSSFVYASFLNVMYNSRQEVYCRPGAKFN